MASRSRLGACFALLGLICIFGTQFSTAIPSEEVDVISNLITTYNIATACGVSGWTSPFQPTDPCGWPRILCSNDSINTLDLSNCGLSGELPNLDALKNMATLRLNNNRFSGELTRAMNMPSLSTVDLSNNNLTGSLNLVLTMRGTGFAVPFIYISNNRFTGDPNAAVSAFGLVSELVASNNSLSTSNLIINSNNIRVLDLSLNSVGAFSGSSMSLQTLNLESVGLSMQLGSTLSSFSSLKSANLAKNQLSGQLPATVPASMEQIYLDSNALTGVIPASFVSSAPWRAISMSQNALSGPLPATFFTSTPALNVLNLANNSLNCFAYLPPTLTTCDVSNNYLCPDILGANTCVPSSSVCYASAISSCKNASEANAICPAARPTAFSVCNTATKLWEFAYWSTPATLSNVTVFNGSLVFPAGPTPYNIRSLTVGFFPVNETDPSAFSSITFESNADIDILDNFVVGAFSEITVGLPDSSKLDILAPNSSSSLPVVHVRGNWTISSQNTTIIVDARQSLPADSLPALWFINSNSLSGNFANQDVLIPDRLNITNQSVGFMCSGYFVFTNEQSAYVSYSLINNPGLCSLPPRVIPPPLPPRGFDVGALIGSIFAVLVLTFVCFAAAMVANEDWHYVLPYNE